MGSRWHAVIPRRSSLCSAVEPSDYSDARAMLGFVVDHGIAPERIVLRKSRAAPIRTLLLQETCSDHPPGEIWVFVTSAYHMPRTMGAFTAVG